MKDQKIGEREVIVNIARPRALVKTEADLEVVVITTSLITEMIDVVLMTEVKVDINLF